MLKVMISRRNLLPSLKKIIEHSHTRDLLYSGMLKRSNDITMVISGVTIMTIQNNVIVTLMASRAVINVNWDNSEGVFSSKSWN